MERLHDSNAAAAAALAIGVSVMLFFEWHTDEPLVVLPVLLLVSFVGGWAAPGRFMAVGAALGWAIPIAHALSTATGAMIPHYQKQPPSNGDWLAMGLLIIPALLASFAGSRIRRTHPS